MWTIAHVEVGMSVHVCMANFKSIQHLTSAPQKLCISFHTIGSGWFFFSVFFFFFFFCVCFCFCISSHLRTFRIVPVIFNHLFCSTLRIACCRFTWEMCVNTPHIPSNECAVANTNTRKRKSEQTRIKTFSTLSMHWNNATLSMHIHTFFGTVTLFNRIRWNVRFWKWNHTAGGGWGGDGLAFGE